MFLSFQFLIGSLEAFWSALGDVGEVLGFQFLIGSLEALATSTRSMNGSSFNSS
ncbi:protein of unknown function [Mesotoga infera]|uniref:Uncharacterized protein n=1 Tax=Mesotoga infera TaxID=1236046 RepID=A0A7Z7LEY4_9BACT|nr:protein of unknown function [Mesotoga infera]